MTLYAASSDGTIAAFRFDPTELEGIATKEDQEAYLEKFGFTPPPVPEGYSHVSEDEPKPSGPLQTNGFENRNGTGKVNVLIAKKKPPKRAGLANTNGTSIPTAKNPSDPLKQLPQTNNVPTSTGPKRATLTQSFDAKPASSALPSSNFPDESEQPFGDPSETWSRRGTMPVGQPMDLDVPISSLSAVSRGKRKASVSAEDVGPKVRPRTLGGDRLVEVYVAKEISSWTKAPASKSNGSNSNAGMNEELFDPLPLLTYLSTGVEGSGETLEAKNNEEDGVYPFMQDANAQLIRSFRNNGSGFDQWQTNRVA